MAASCGVPFGSVLSLLAQVGGAADCFHLWGIFSWPTFDTAKSQPSDHSPDRRMGGCESLHLSIQGFGNSCLQRRRGGGEMPGKCHSHVTFVDLDQTRRFWPGSVFL